MFSVFRQISLYWYRLSIIEHIVFLNIYWLITKYKNYYIIWIYYLWIFRLHSSTYKCKNYHYDRKDLSEFTIASSCWWVSAICRVVGCYFSWCGTSSLTWGFLNTSSWGRANNLGIITCFLQISKGSCCC